MKLEEIHKMWSEDSIIDKRQLDVESLETPKLHAKYLKVLSQERLRYKTLEENRKTLLSNLTGYYDGTIDGRDIGREPWQLIDKTKASLEKRIDADKAMIEMNLKIASVEERIIVLKEIITNINNRGFQIKNSIDFMKFMNGGY